MFSPTKFTLIEICCSVWQCVAACEVRRGVLQFVATCGSMLQRVRLVEVCGSVLQCVAVCCSV